MPALSELVEEGAFRAAYARVLQLWQRKPYASLAALVTELAAHAVQEKAPADETLPRPDAARSRLDGVIVEGNSVVSREKLADALAELPPDPYVFDWMVQELGHPRFDVATGNPRRLYTLIVEEMSKLKDERVAPWRADLPAFLQARKGRRHGQLSPDEIEALGEMFASCTFTPPFLEALTEEEEADLAGVRAPLDTLKGRAAERDGQRARLFAQVCADFEDDVAKEVFADYLLEEGDPLGEYIVLGLKLAREGALPPELERRHHSLMDHARRFQPMGFAFERGFAVTVRFTDGEGVRRGSYGPEAGWGTIATSDVPPTSDDCHTQSLRELDLGSTFIADLAKLKKPLRVTRLKWRTPSQAGRAKWKKVTVLPELEQLSVAHPGDGSFDWLVREGPGRTVRELAVEKAWSWGRHVAWVAELLATPPEALSIVRLGPHLVFTRRDGRVKLAIGVPDARVLEELHRELAQAPRPLVDEVVVDGPAEASVYANLLTLGRTATAEHSTSPAARDAQVTREGDTLTIVPAREHPVFDVPALRAVLASAKGARRVAIGSAVQIEETGAYLRAVHEVGGAELSLAVGPPAWHRGRFSLTATADTLDVDVGRADQIALVRGAIASLGGHVKKLVVRHPPSLNDVATLTAPLRALADELELVPEERVLAAMCRLASTKGRVAIEPVAAGARLMPPTADLVLAGKPRPKELRIGQRDFALAPWIQWVARNRIPVTFAVDWRVTALSKLSWEDGIVARLWVDGHWSAFVAAAADVPDEAIAQLDLRSSIAPTAEAKATIRRIAKAHSIAS